MESLKLLLASDDPSDYHHLQEVLAGIPDCRFELHWTRDLESFLEMINGDMPDLCLVGSGIGEHTGLELILRARSGGIRFPLVLLEEGEPPNGKPKKGKDPPPPVPEENEAMASQLLSSMRSAIDRHRISEALSRMPENLGRLSETVQLGISLIDRDHNIVLSNAFLGRLLGISHTEMIGKKCFAVFKADGKICDYCPLKYGDAPALPHTRTETWIAIDGRPRQVKVERLPIRGTDGEVTAFAKIVEELREAPKEALPALRCEEQFRIMVDSAPVLLWILGPDMKCHYFNQSMLNFTGDTLKGELSYEWTEGVHPEDLPACLEAYFAAFETRSGFSIECRLLRCDGEYRWTLVNGVPCFSPEKLFAGHVCSCTDITEHRQTEILLQELNESLEQRVDQRTRALRRANKVLLDEIGERKHLEEVLVEEKCELETAQQELRRAYAQLKATQAKSLQQEKMASLGQLAAGMAHEINNPLSFITSNLRTLSKYVDRISRFLMAQKLEPSGAEAEAVTRLEELRGELKIDFILEDIGTLVRESLEGTERVSKIVQDLKTFSRVDEAEYKLADINHCIESTITVAWNDIKYKAVLERDFGELPLARCYPRQLSQVFLNLLINAAQAIARQGVIRIRTWHHDGNIHVSISDTGCGIPDGILERIFEPFFTTKEVGQGTGLGLSITYDIVKRHKGDIRVRTAPGKGTTFTVQVPVGNAKGEYDG